MASGESRFGRRLTVGVEEELMLLHPETFALAPGVETLLGSPRLKTEVFSCLVETNTPVCEDAHELGRELRGAREQVGMLAEREGLVVAAVAMHPFSRAAEQPIVEEPRYVALAAELGPKVYRQLVCGLHVHVGMTSFAECLATLEAILPWLPAVLALSLNSPYEEGRETGSLSTRAGRLLELPRGGPPPPLATEQDWEREIAASGEDYSRVWWDARPHPRLGTLEVRIADQPTSVDRSVALAALVQALCVAAEPAAEPLDRAAYLEDRRAAANGIARTAELLRLVEPAASALGTTALLEPLQGPVEAERQLGVGREGDLAVVARDLVSRSG